MVGVDLSPNELKPSTSTMYGGTPVPIGSPRSDLHDLVTLGDWLISGKMSPETIGWPAVGHSTRMRHRRVSRLQRLIGT